MCFVGHFDSFAVLTHSVSFASRSRGPRPKAEDHERAPEARVEWYPGQESNL
jgi:hypothetical protein